MFKLQDYNKATWFQNFVASIWRVGLPCRLGGERESYPVAQGAPWAGRRDETDVLLAGSDVEENLHTCLGLAVEQLFAAHVPVDEGP